MKRTVMVLMLILTVLALSATSALAVGGLKDGPWPGMTMSSKASY